MPSNGKTNVDERRGPAVIGLTGGIASGKTVATNALRAAGFTVIDADEASRAITAHGTPAEKELMRMFPSAADGDTLDRKALREIIAENADARARLNSYAHPLIIREINRQISAAPKPVVLSAPLLFETGLDGSCDAVVCITCPRETRLKRLIERDGTDTQTAERLIDAQLSDAERKERSDYIVSSNCEIREFTSNIISIFKSMISR